MVITLPDALSIEMIFLIGSVMTTWLPSSDTASTVPGEVMSVRVSATVLIAVTTIKPVELPR